MRWWLDQSPYTNDKRLRQTGVFRTDRDIGQDDHDRPGCIPVGCNGKPCGRGGLIGKAKGDKHNQQPCYFEFQMENRDFRIDGPFRIFLLARPVQQAKDATIFGQFHKPVLSQSATSNRLEWKNGGQRNPISAANTLKTDTWQLLELHRNSRHQLQCVIDGNDVTVGTPSDSLPIVFMFLFNNSKGQGFAKQYPFAGDIAALVIYRDELVNDVRVKVRQYFERVYDLKLQS